MGTPPADMEKTDDLLSENPDWSEIRETILMLDFAVARMSHAMSDGNDSVDTLIESFTHMAGQVESIQATAETLTETGPREELQAQCDSMQAKMGQAITAFQFYDRLSQRMQHITNSLDAMAVLINEEEQRNSRQKWHELKTMIRANYTLESDKQMFESLLAGTSVSDIISQATQPRDADSTGEIELF